MYSAVKESNSFLTHSRKERKWRKIKKIFFSLNHAAYPSISLMLICEKTRRHQFMGVGEGRW